MGGIDQQTKKKEKEDNVDWNYKLYEIKDEDMGKRSKRQNEKEMRIGTRRKKTRRIRFENRGESEQDQEECLEHTWRIDERMHCEKRCLLSDKLMDKRKLERTMNTIKIDKTVASGKMDEDEIFSRTCM